MGTGSEIIILTESLALAAVALPAAERLVALGQTVAVAESAAGGLISATLLAVAGASKFYAGGIVMYTRQSRKTYLDLDPVALKGLAPLSEAMVMVFAAAARQSLGATWGIAELGAAGPAGTPYGHPAGSCVIGISGPVDMSVRIDTGSADREANMWRFTQEALTLLAQATGKALDQR